MRPDVVPIPKLRFATFGIYAKESWRITPSQLESCRLVLVRTIGKPKGEIWCMFICTVCVYGCPLCVANASYGEAALVSTIAWYVPMECCVGTT